MGGNIKLSVRNFGPIREATDIELRPLTLFAGPSNTGKSYLAALIYSLFHCWAPSQEYGRRRYRNRRLFSDHIDDLLDKMRNAPSDQRAEGLLMDIIAVLSAKNDQNSPSKERRDISASLSIGELSPESQESMKNWTSKLIEAMAPEMRREIFRCMGVSSWKELAHRGRGESAEDFQLEIVDQGKGWSWSILEEESTLKMEGAYFKDTDLLSPRSMRHLLRRLSDLFQGRDAVVRDLHEEDKRYDEVDKGYIIESLLEELYEALTADLLLPAFYFPASRTGIMQSHQVIVRAVLNRAASAGVESLAIPALTGILADFIQMIISTSSKRGRGLYHPSPKIADKIAEIGRIAKLMEEETLKGSVALEEEKIPYPKFIYKQQGVQTPLIRSSSMVSELASLSLFIKRFLYPGNLMIIEEPESHLHLGAQRSIVKTIVRLVRAGVKVLITTHSEYILEQLSNYIRIGEYRKREGGQLPLDIEADRELYLDQEEIGGYLFKAEAEKEENAGTVVAPLEFDTEAGLSPKDHEEVSSALYNETVAILDSLCSLLLSTTVPLPSCRSGCRQGAAPANPSAR